jgi:hypothetical protein
VCAACNVICNALPAMLAVGVEEVGAARIAPSFSEIPSSSQISDDEGVVCVLDEQSKACNL